MQTIKLSEGDARAMYAGALPEIKTLLESSFGGKEFFYQKIKDRVKTFEDACKACGIDYHDELDRMGKFKPDEAAYNKIKIIAKALNEGWVPDWTKNNQYKYYPWFDLSSGSGLSFDGYGLRHLGFGCRLAPLLQVLRAGYIRRKTIPGHIR
jgi:hypothetical protein